MPKRLDSTPKVAVLRIFALKINSKFELRRVCRTVGATSIVRSGPPLPEECGYVESIKAGMGDGGQKWQKSYKIQ